MTTDAGDRRSHRSRPGVIAAGGHGNAGTRLGDYIVAFALRD